MEAFALDEWAYPSGHRSRTPDIWYAGPVFRVSPNELSFASVASWKAIYGHRPADKGAVIKSEFYDMYGAGFESLCVGSERNPLKHNQMRKSLSSAFSTKALSEQESIVARNIDAFVLKVGQDGGPGSDGLNMSKWYEMNAFDVLGDMAFGESFHCIENGKPHFWQELILSHLFYITVADNLRRFPLISSITKALFPSTVAVRNQNSMYSREKVARKSTRKDFLSTLRRALIRTSIAGGETVATFLAATTFYLLQEDACYDKLRAEVRSCFPSYESINATAAQQLPYLQAVIEEGLRIYPPGSQGFPRISPGIFVDGYWVPKDTEIYTSAWSVTHDMRNFHDPMKFKPERWLETDCTDIKEASQPFSLGSRGCLGRNFAIMEINLTLAKLVWRYDMELVDKGLDWLGSSAVWIMWAKPALMVRFHERVP
ncbi:MAG: hypothetical protein Q9187_000389 [Circinaria calcarea]